MRTFLAFMFLIIIQGCSIYPGTYYAPHSKLGDVVSVGHCGDNSPSKLIFDQGNVKVSTQAGDVHINYDQTWIWFEVESKELFDLKLPPQSILFLVDGEQILPYEVNYFYRVSDNEWYSNDLNSLAELPTSNHRATHFRLVFKFKKQKNINLKMNMLQINKLSQPVEVEFKTVEKIRISALNC